MNRRESLKALGLTAVSTGLLLEACKSKSALIVDKTNLDDTSGRQDFEIERLKKLRSETFFDAHEMETLTVLADMIIPRDDISGSASDAKVPEFIEFIVKDIPEHQVPMRGGLKWLDMQCLKVYGHSFKACSASQQMEILKEIAYPNKSKAGMHQGVVFFDRMRSLTATGFYTSEIGIKDLGYVGNTPTIWKGVPADVLAQYNLADV